MSRSKILFSMAKGYIDPIEVIRENIENIFISSLYVSELKPYQLEEIISYEKTRKRILLKKYGLDGSVMLSGIDFFMEADPTMEDYQKWVTAEQMETIVKAEQQRRKGEAVTITRKTEAGRTTPTHAQLAAFYRTMLHLGAYPEFTANGRTMEENYKEIGARHDGVSPAVFKRTYRKTHGHKSMGELINALTFEVVESLIQALPEKEMAMDLLKIEKAKG